MKLAIATVAGLAAAATAQSMTVDLSGQAADGLAPTVLNANNANSGAITSIDYNINVEAISPSWGSEINITLTHVASGWSFNADGDDADFSDDGPADFLFGFGNTSGVFNFSGSVAVSGLADVNGAWTVTLADDFDDSVNPDHQYLADSSVTVNSVPAPAGLALLGLGGMVAARRRR